MISLASSNARPVTRETAYRIRGRPVVVTLRPGGLLVEVREKGRRTRYTVTVQEIYVKACWNAAAQLRRERAEKRKAKREAKGT